MSEYGIPFESLNAYVDGELNAAESAEVALAIAGSPLLARQVAALSRLRSAVIDATDTPAIQERGVRDDCQNSKADTTEKGAGPAGRQIFLYAACISLLAVIVGSVMVWGYVQTRSSQPPWFAEAAEVHALWADDATTQVQTTASGKTSTALARAFVPDLTAAKLFINHVLWRYTSNGNSVLVVGYRGTRGCRVTLAIFAEGADFPAERTSAGVEVRLAYAWRVGKLGYAVLADGMDPARYSLIVKTVHIATLQNLPPDENAQTAMSESRRRSAPCQA